MDSCNFSRSLLLQVDDSLTELLPVVSLEVPGTLRSMAYIRHLYTGTHYLLLGANDGRLFQVKSRVYKQTSMNPIKLISSVRNNANFLDLQHTCYHCWESDYLLKYKLKLCEKNM